MPVEKLKVLRSRGWEVYVDFAPARYVKNILAAVATPAELAEACARGFVLFYYAASTPAGVFIYGAADPAQIPGRARGELKRVDPSFGCLVLTAVKRGGVGVVKELYEAVALLEKPPPGSLSLEAIEELDICKNPPAVLEPYCRLLESLKKKPQINTTRGEGAARRRFRRSVDEAGWAEDDERLSGEADLGAGCISRADCLRLCRRLCVCS